MKPFALALALSLLPLPALATDQLGQITASIDGGAPQQWFLTAEGGESQSAANKVMNGLTDVSLWGHATAETASSVEGALLIDFNLITLGGTPSTADATLQYLVEGYKGGFLAIADGATRVTVTRAETEGATLHIAGSFTATAAYSDQPMLQLTDDSRQVKIEGTFEATLPEG